MKEKKRKILFLIVIIIIIVSATIFFINNFNNDGMQNTKDISIYYKTYTKEDGWSKWSKNGLTSGDKTHSIKNIKIKYKTKSKGSVIYKTYSNDNWSNDLYSNSNAKNNDIKGLKFSTGDIIYKKYNICYRTYNKEDKWLRWTCDGYVSGNINQDITAIEVKIIPKNIIKNEWLRDYNKGNNNTNIGF